MTPDLDLTSLRWSLVVAKSGGFRRAADMLGIEQSALSRRVRRIEDELGVSLFQRSVRGTSPTNAGDVFLRRVDTLLQGLGVAVSDAQAAGQGQAGRLRIGLTFSHLSTRLFDLIARYHAAHPRVRIELSEGSSADHLEAVADRRLDLAVLPGGTTVTGLDVSELWQERLIIAVPASHPLAERAVIELVDLRGERLLVSDRDMGKQAFAAVAWEPDFGIILDIQQAGGGLLLEQTRMGLGLTLMGSGAIGGLRLDDDLRFPSLLSDIPQSLSVAAAWSSNNDNPALRRFVSTVRLQDTGRKRGRAAPP